MMFSQLFTVRKKLDSNQRIVISVLSFIVPLLIWSLVSYVPFIWHPKVEITMPGDVSYFNQGMLIDREIFDREVETVKAESKTIKALK